MQKQLLVLYVYFLKVILYSQFCRFVKPKSLRVVYWQLKPATSWVKFNDCIVDGVTFLC